MQKATFGKWFKAGGLVALAMTGIITSGCGGGGGGSSAGTPSGANSGTDSSTGTGTGSSTGTGTGSSTGTSTGTITGANSAPTISATPATQASVGTAYTLAPQASDADGDTLAFSIQNKPTWAEFSTSTGQLTGTPTTQSTTSNIVISVSDGKTSAALPAFSITVGTTVASSSPTPAASPPTPVPSGSNVALAWDVPTHTVEGETLQNLSGYRIHYGTSENAMVNAIEVQSAGQNSFTVQNLPAGTYYFAVRAITSTGDESKLSNIIARIVS